jgi:hypothetical protein
VCGVAQTSLACFPLLLWQSSGIRFPESSPGFRIPFRFKDIVQTINPDTELLNKPDDKRNKKFAKSEKKKTEKRATG